MKLKIKPVTQGELLAVTVRARFKDGAFSSDFASLGYRVDWKPGKMRLLPRELISKLEQRGCLVMLAGDDEPEDFKPSPTQPEDVPQTIAGKYDGHPLLTVVALGNFTSGPHAAEFEKLGYPAMWLYREVRQIPMGLFAELKTRGADNLSVNTEDLERWKHLQPNFKAKNAAWLRERRASSAKRIAAYETEQEQILDEARKAARRAELGV